MSGRLRTTMLLTMLAGSCASVLVGQQARPPHWSEDLSRYGYSAEHPYSDVAVAASTDNIAVALNVNQDRNASPSMPRHFLSSDWKLSVLIFNADDGKLRATCGPWFDGFLFNLWSTSNGNFLLYQEPSPSKPGSSSRVFLLSPACQRLKQIELSALGKQAGAEFFTSPTQRTFLIEEQSGLNAQFEVRDANTLYTRLKFGIDAEDLRAVAVSDEGLLIVRSVRPGLSTRAPMRLFYFDFHTQKWSEIPGPDALDSSESVTFVSNGNFLEAAPTGSLGAWATTGIRISIRGIDGTAAFATVISHANTHIAPGSPFAISLTGNYFGVVLSSYSVASFWRFLDMSPRHDQVYIWSKQSEKPLVHIGVRSGSLYQQLAFAPDDSWFALRSGKILMVRPLPRPPIPKL
jgi:hypothetical protein